MGISVFPEPSGATAKTVGTPSVTSGVPAGVTLQHTISSSTSSVAYNQSGLNAVFVIAIGGGGSGNTLGGGGAGAAVSGWTSPINNITIGAGGASTAGSSAGIRGGYTAFGNFIAWGGAGSGGNNDSQWGSGAARVSSSDSGLVYNINAMFMGAIQGFTNGNGGTQGTNGSAGGAGLYAGGAGGPGNSAGAAGGAATFFGRNGGTRTSTGGAGGAGALAAGGNSNTAAGGNGGQGGGGGGGSQGNADNNGAGGNGTVLIYY